MKGHVSRVILCRPPESLLLLYSRHDFVQGDWPAPLKRAVHDQPQRFEACLESFAGHGFGRVGPAEIRRVTFVLAEVPIAAVKTHLQRREPPPSLVDELITKTYHAIVGGGDIGGNAGSHPVFFSGVN